MEQGFDNNFERFVRDAAGGHRMYPTDRVWNGIYDRVHGKKRMFAIAVTSLVLLLTLFIFRDSRNSTVPGQQAAGTNQKSNSTKLSRLATIPSPEAATPQPPAQPAGAMVGHRFLTATGTTPANRPGNLISAIEYPVQEEEYTPGNKTTTAWAPVTAIETAPVIIEKTPVLPAGITAPGADQAHESDAAPLNNDRHDRISQIIKQPLPQQRPAKQAAAKTASAKSISFGWYAAPGISYRSMYDTRTPGSGDSGNLDKALHHKPGMGMEAGVVWRMQFDRRLRLKIGVQLNYNHYNIKAIPATRTMGQFNLTGDNGILDLPASYTNISGVRESAPSRYKWLENQNLQISIPVGMEFEVAGNDKAQLNIGATLQPSYLIRDNSYLVTTDLKKYASKADLKVRNKENYFVRRFNMNAAIEAFITFKTGENTRWHIGPQLRYQLFSSYNKAYPIKENLIDYNFRLGFSRTIR